MKAINLVFCFIVVFSWAQDTEKVSTGQMNAIAALAGQKGLDHEALNNLVLQRFNLSLDELSKQQAAALITEFQSPNSTPNTQNKQNNTSQSLVLAEILEVGMAKKFHLRDGNIIHGSITEIIDGYFEKPIFIDVDFSNADLKGTVINDAIIIGDTVLNCKNNQICK